MKKNILVFCLFVAVLMALLVMLCVRGTDVLESNEAKGSMTSPLFATRLNSTIKDDTHKIQTNYIGRFGKQLEIPLSKPQLSEDEETIAFHNGNIWNGFGPTYFRLEWDAAIRITPDELEPYDGWEIIGARFYHWEIKTHKGSLKIYDEGTDISPGDLITSEPYNISGKGWRRINLTNPAPLNVTKDIWTSILIIKEGSADYPMGIDSGPAVDGKGDWIKLNSGWWELQDFGFCYNWGIEAIVYYPYLKAYAGGPYEGFIGEDIEFKGDATGGSLPYSWFWDFGDGNTSTYQYPCHAYQEFGNYTVILTVTDNESNTTSDTTWALILNAPPNKPSIDGETNGRAGVSYPYTFETNDPEGLQVWYYIEWGDGSDTGWIGPYPSGDEITKSHSWSEKDTYTIRCKVKDPYECESEWGELEVTMPMNQQSSNVWFLRLLERFSLLNRLLSLQIFNRLFFLLRLKFD